MADSLISNLDFLVESWKEQFENRPNLVFHWKREEGLLYLNGKELCPASDILSRALCFGTQFIRLVLKDGWIDIIIEWPHKGDAYLSEFVYHKRIA